MAALTKDKVVTTRGIGRRRKGGVEAATTIFNGALLAVNAAGWIVNASDTAAIFVIGVAVEQVVNAGAAGAKSIEYVTGLDLEVENAGGAIVQAGNNVFAFVADNQSVTTAAVAANDCRAGYVVEFTAAKVIIYVDELIGRL